MTTSHAPITCLDDLIATWRDVLSNAPLRGRNLWLMFLDTSGAPHPALTQIEGLSLAADDVAVANLADIVRRLLDDDAHLAGAALCLERGGTLGASPFEEAWADALTRELGAHLAWPVLARTPGGIAPVRLRTRAA